MGMASGMVMDIEIRSRHRRDCGMIVTRVCAVMKMAMSMSMSMVMVMVMAKEMVMVMVKEMVMAIDVIPHTFGVRLKQRP